MDYRLLLLLHSVQGFQFENEDLAAVLHSGVDVGDPRAVVATLVSEFAQAYFANRPGWAGESARILETSEKSGVRWSYPGLEDYPQEWLHLNEQPPVFSYLGEPCWKVTPMLAVVGSRTPMGSTLRWMQRELGGFLKESGVGVASGGARGVDQWAHRICMDENQPTVCLLPTGILQRYPPGQEAFWERILAGGGALVSTFGLHQPMRKNHFHIRNRWIAGFSHLVFVAEANRRSGSLITADRAREESRTICTLPVSPLSEQGLANLDLLESGAKLIRDRRDLFSNWADGCNRFRSRFGADF